MAKLESTGRSKRPIAKSKDEQIAAAMGKAIREVKRQAALNNAKLAVAGKNAWVVPK